MVCRGWSRSLNTTVNRRHRCDSGNKIIATADCVESRIATIARPLVFTNGCFDILHRGHVAYLEAAAKFGVSLVVALNSDASVRRLGKSADRPINSLDDRMAIIAALQCVDWVVAFDQDTPLELICLMQPDYLIKGGDWATDAIVGADEVRSWGGHVDTISVEFPRSTTDILNRIRSSPA